MRPYCLDRQKGMYLRRRVCWMKIWTPILARRMRNFSSHGPMQRKWHRQLVSFWMACLALPAVESQRYEQLHRHLARLPVPEKKIISANSHTETVEGGLLKTMSEEELKRFTPSELLLYKIASEHRYIQLEVHTCTYKII